MCGSSILAHAPAPEQDGPAYAEAWLSVLKNVSKDDAVQYVLASVEQAFAGMGPAHNPACRSRCSPAPRTGRDAPRAARSRPLALHMCDAQKSKRRSSAGSPARSGGPVGEPLPAHLAPRGPCASVCGAAAAAAHAERLVCPQPPSGRSPFSCRPAPSSPPAPAALPGCNPPAGFPGTSRTGRASCCSRFWTPARTRAARCSCTPPPAPSRTWRPAPPGLPSPACWCGRCPAGPAVSARLAGLSAGC